MKINRWRIVQVAALVLTSGGLFKIGAPWELFAGLIAIAIASYEAGRRIEPVSATEASSEDGIR